MSMSPAEPVHQVWSSRLAFIFAAVGSAVGLGNLWRFPYIVGENGGGAFVVIYIACMLLLGIPLITAELLIGRRGQQSAINTMRTLASEENVSPLWAGLGWLMVIIPLLGLTYYSVVAGWGLAYVVEAVQGTFTGISGDDSNQLFNSLTADPLRLAIWHGIFMAVTVFIVARGVNAGLEKAASLMTPALFVILIILVVYGMFAADFSAGFHFLFNMDFSKITGKTVLMALGQAFFSLSIAVGVMMTYGAYLPKDVSLPKAAATVALADTAVALLAGLAIFPVVFASGLAPDSGPGLIFVTMPVALGQMPASILIATLFFVLLCFAAITTGIGMLEPAVSWLEEHKGMKRPHMAVMTGILCWALGLSSVLSFNIWSDVFPLGFIESFAEKTIFDLLDMTLANFLIPLGGLLIAIFAGWAMSRSSTIDELGLGDGRLYRLWHFLIRYLAPLAVLMVFLSNI
ncbi:MAG: sodium-dependent transporter [Gammaproteobacteria bacterium]|nr:sodium-dependent transporter [Gammaproteobacteria bacterium]